MLHKTQGIVLTHYKYAETSLVVHIFTCELGIQSYMVNGVWKKNGKFKAALFQPLTILDMQVYFKQNKGMQRIKEVNLLQANHSILSNIHKSTIALFLAELLHKTIKIESADFETFQFVLKKVNQLENEDKAIADFPTEFMREYSQFIGIIPQPKNNLDNSYFDLLSGSFKTIEPLHPMFFNKDESELFNISLKAENTSLSRAARQKLTDLWVDYYKMHFESLSSLKSLKVLREVFE